MKKNLTKFVSLVLIVAVILSFSGCDLLSKTFSKKDISTYLSNDIGTFTKLRETEEANKILEKYLMPVVKTWDKDTNTFKEAKNKYLSEVLKKLEITKFKSEEILADLENVNYLVSPKEGPLDLTNLITKAQTAANPEDTVKQLIDNLNIVHINELKSDDNFSKFYNNLVKSLGKNSNLKLTSEKVNGTTIYNIKGNLADYFLSPIIKDANAIAQINKVWGEASFAYTGDYLLCAFKSAGIKNILKTDKENNEEIQKRLKEILDSEEIFASYDNSQASVNRLLATIGDAVKSAPLPFSMAGTVIDKINESDIKNLPLYSTEFGKINGDEMEFVQTMYKNPDVIAKFPDLNVVASTKKGSIPLNKFSDILFFGEINDLDKQINYVENLILALGIIDKESINKYISIAGSDIPLFNLMKSTFAGNENINLNLFIIPNPNDAKDEPIVNLLLSHDDLSQVFIDLESAIATHNAAISKDKDQTEKNRKLKLDKINDDLFKLSAETVKVEDSEISDENNSQNIYEPIVYFGKIEEKKLMYLGLIIRDEIHKDENFVKILNTLKEKQESIIKEEFTNAIYVDLKNVIDLGLAIGNTNRDEALNKLKKSLEDAALEVKKNNPEIANLMTASIESYMNFYSAILNSNDVSIVHKIESAEKSMINVKIKLNEDKLEVKEKTAVKKKK
ncbi:hypothetical protein A2483_02375 [Candidatus Peregrinibacteria bacterium RIFOXYC2_FULL_33_13]|nr:MAG: hypothetical protein UR27_C0004G0026 [Candidatus Peregrinibacteria bacterium GW2011_GWA2_33_10]KKP41173.1 MAG: hypothetical protein UR30_C0001G0020 [Candidatus Peregrinibacteria bacterium GW2011_GWC2_33_13]OGJ47906.1 MAG: hypothetical protein A2229_00100 [Candidatus Peregrinibacteria bacterium RIFOXYA2_FULL_33_7]OGJ52658.1 MAG: hypothetical protein A2483_02375 [Candidatus Peregrinibacteria bacterium RIFOXYC2_FULL_33_13]